MKTLLLLGLAPLALARPAIAQDHSGHAMPATGGQHAEHAAGQQAPEPPVRNVDPHAGHDMSAMREQQAAPSGTNLPPGNAPAPVPTADRAADRYYGAEAMAEAERDLRREHGGGAFRQVMVDIAEYRPRRGKDGYRWDGEAWIGGDIDRFWLKSEGEGRFGDHVESAEVQALYSRAVDPYWNLQAGVRQDLGRRPRRTYAVLGIEGLAPYWFEVEGSLFLSDKGDLLARAEGYYDQRITQNLVLQPRAELDFAFQDVPENAIGSGLSSAELGLRLRYERVREFAPYAGVSWERKLGRTADFARGRGEDTGGANFVLGIRTWF
ncbi:copper resistance protein B [Sphingomonas sp. DT-204]|uniref:copper resistance protein B n=1 Tax=Sphingomonas sp. DT-204 TaxID=3396166 RepID=UPI003F1D664F